MATHYFQKNAFIIIRNVIEYEVIIFFLLIFFSENLDLYIVLNVKEDEFKCDLWDIIFSDTL